MPELRHTRLKVLLWLTVVTVLVPTLHVAAQAGLPPTPGSEEPSGPAFVLRPVDGQDGDFITVTADPGASVEQRVLIGNAGDQPIRLRTYVADTAPIDNGGFSVAAWDIAPSGTATWITWPTEEITFQPDEGQERALTVTVPTATAPGQYIAGLVLETAEATAVAGSDQFTQVVRKSIAVFITVPGPESPTFALGDPAFVVTGTNETIRIPVSNTGNVLVKPEGELTVVDTAGENVLTRPVAMRSVYAGTETAIVVPLDAQLPDGDYVVTLTLTDRETGASTSLTDMPLAIVRETAAPPTLTIAGSVTLQPVGDTPVYADVDVEIVNSGAPIDASEVVLEVSRDGELVETFTLIPALALAQGTTDANQRYISPQGFPPGEWTFSLRLNTMDPTTQTRTMAATTNPLPPIVVAP